MYEPMDNGEGCYGCRSLATRVALADERIAELESALKWIATMDLEPWSIDTVQEVRDMAAEAVAGGED
jgi:hypothetical protein